MKAENKVVVICEQCGKKSKRHKSAIRGKCFCDIPCRREFLAKRKILIAEQKEIKRKERSKRVVKNKQSRLIAKKQSAERRRLALLKYNQTYVTKKNINPKDVRNIALKFIGSGCRFIKVSEPKCFHNRTTVIEDANFNEASPVKSMVICLDCGTEATALHLIVAEKGTAKYGKGLTPAMLRPVSGLIKTGAIKPVNRERKFRPEQKSGMKDNNSIF